MLEKIIFQVVIRDFKNHLTLTGMFYIFCYMDNSELFDDSLSPCMEDEWRHGPSTADMCCFREEGWMGPFKLLSAEGVRRVMDEYRTCRIRFHHSMPGAAGTSQFDEQAGTSQFNEQKCLWMKSMHIYLPLFARIVSHPAVVEKVAAVLAQPLIAWGTTIVQRGPGEVHRWHGDVEHYDWEGVSAFLGLAGISAGSSLKVVTGSHRFGNLPQAFGHLSDDQIQEKASRLYPAATVKTIEVSEGGFFLFAGKLWHGSSNRSQETRSAMLAQYASSSARIRIPLNFDEPVKWDTYRPPCLLVKGRPDDQHANQPNDQRANQPDDQRANPIVRVDDVTRDGATASAGKPGKGFVR
jgi:Phytanoyl-CoA dioxygenase (PhyH)